MVERVQLHRRTMVLVAAGYPVFAGIVATVHDPGAAPLLTGALLASAVVASFAAVD